MTGSRERVLLALNHCEPDRVPLSLGGTASSFTDDAYFQLKSYLGIEGDIPPFRYGHTGCYYDDRVLDALGTDYRYLVLSFPNANHLQYWPDGSWVDEWGIRNKYVEGYVTRVAPAPLADADLDDLDHYPWPDAHGADFQPLARGLKERARDLRDQGDYAIVARAAMSTAFLENGAWLCGYEQFLMHLKNNRAFAAKLIQKLLEVQLGMYELLLAEIGEWVDIVETAEDYGSQSSLLIGPVTYREMIQPARKRLNQAIREMAPHARILHHTCGSVAKLIPDLLASGIDILNPVQPTAAGMDGASLKREWGDQLCFDGGIDTQYALTSGGDALVAEVATRLLQLGPGGGYSLGPSNHIQADVAPENVVFLFEMAKDLGRYPLDHKRLAALSHSELHHR